jgi:hypothetical protein
MASSAAAGAAAQTLTNTRKAIFGTQGVKYVPVKAAEWNGREAAVRAGAGTLAGVVAGAFDLATGLKELGMAARGTAAHKAATMTTAMSTAMTTDSAAELAPNVAEHASKGVTAGLKTFSTLNTWFGARDSLGTIGKGAAPKPIAKAEVAVELDAGALTAVVVAPARRHSVSGGLQTTAMPVPGQPLSSLDSFRVPRNADPSSAQAQVDALWVAAEAGLAEREREREASTAPAQHHVVQETRL